MGRRSSSRSRSRSRDRNRDRNRDKDRDRDRRREEKKRRRERTRSRSRSDDRDLSRKDSRWSTLFALCSFLSLMFLCSVLKKWYRDGDRKRSRDGSIADTDITEKQGSEPMASVATETSDARTSESTFVTSIKEEDPPQVKTEEPDANDDKKRQRQERLRLWKEQQEKKSQSTEIGGGLCEKVDTKIKIEESSVTSPIIKKEKETVFSFAKPNSKPASAKPNSKPASNAGGLGKFDFSKKKLVVSSKTKPKVGMDVSKAFSIKDEKLDIMEPKTDVGEDVDPLDAFMTGIDDETKDEDVADDLDVFMKVPEERPSINNIITMEEIFGKTIGDEVMGDNDIQEGDWEMDDEDGVKSSPLSRSRPYGGVTPGRNEPEESDEAREEREKKERADFMEALKKQREAEQEAEKVRLEEEREAENKRLEEEAKKPKKKEQLIGAYFEEDDRVADEDDVLEDEKSALEKLEDLQAKKQVAAVDHSKIDYMPFRKRFYIVPREIADMKESDVQKLRTELEIKTRGNACPRPVRTWMHCGLGDKINTVMEKYNFKEPFPIQRQALPAIMSGRDVIGIAKTGSGKTLAFVLPMIRHILDQPRLEFGESGPIGLIMAPARELCLQIYNEVRKFAKPLGLSTTAVYGGAGVSEQIGALKRGSDIVVCTPGRMIDILTMNAGKLISLARVTYVVMDEADRMFDMGFEPQINSILKNVRPDRQLVLFSATFPLQVEALARKVLTAPIEVTVGLRSVASGDITQYVEVRDEEDKFPRLLQLLGLWCERGNILIFADSQSHCDVIFKDLMRSGYPSLCLHGGMEQV
jgi:ATP-dependent RNA helicase DDX46/PRP5